jgi:hypothetical protein
VVDAAVGVAVAALTLRSIGSRSLGAPAPPCGCPIIIIAVPCTTWCPMVAQPLAALLPAEGSVALANLTESTTRTGVTVAAIALVLAIQIVDLARTAFAIRPGATSRSY